MQTAGYAALQIIPSMQGISASMEKQLQGVMPQAGQKAGQSFGSGFGGAVASATKVAANATATALTAATATGVSALAKGWGRLTTIQDSSAALEISLGSSAKAGDVLAGVLETVKGTPFNLDQFAQAGQQMVGMGIEAEKVPGYLTAIGEASATQGGRAGEFAGRLSTVFGQISASGQVTLADVWRISDTGVNALAILANSYGVTTDEMKDMISEGAVPAGEALDTLAKGITEGSDGPAGATVALAGTMEKLRLNMSGAVAGISPALARLGAAVIKPFSPTVVAGANGLVDTIDRLTDRAGAFADSIAKSPAIDKLVEFFTDMPDLVDNGIEGLDKIAPVSGAALAGLAAVSTGGTGMIGKFLPTINPVAAAIVGLIASTPSARAALGDLVADAVPLVMELGDRLIPIAEDLSVIMGNVLPAALDLAGLGINVALDGVTLLADVVGPATALIADHSGIVAGAGTAWFVFSQRVAVGKALSTASGWLSAGSAAMTALSTATVTTTGAMGLAGLSIDVVRTKLALMSATTAGVVGAIGLVGGAFAYGYMEMQKWKQAGSDMAADWAGIFESQVDPKSLADYDDLIAKNLEFADGLEDARRSSSAPWDMDYRDSLQAGTNDARELAKALAGSAEAAKGNFASLASSTGISSDALQRLAVSAGIDLLEAFDDTGEPVEELQTELDRLSDLAAGAGTDMESIQFTPEQIAKLEEDGKTIDATMKAVAGSMAGFADILQLKDESLDPKQRKAAEDAVTKARERVAEAEKEARAGGQTADEAERTAEAFKEAKVALVEADAARKELLATDSPLNQDKIRQFYADTIAETQAFSANVRAAIELGYDPAYVGRLLQAGPEQAGPILEALVTDTTGSFVEMVNSAERELSALSLQAVEMARLTQIAVNDTSVNGQQMVQDLSLATQISLAQMSNTGVISVGKLAEITGSTITEVQRVAGAFNLELDNIQANIDRLMGDATVLMGMSTGQILGSGGEPTRDLAGRRDQHRSRHGRANGGPFDPGWLLAGERGPELMYVGSPGHVTTATSTERMMRGLAEDRKAVYPAPSHRRERGPMSLTVNSGASSADVIRDFMWEAGR